MIPALLSDIAAAVNGKLAGGDCQISAVTTDTRDEVCDSLFVALKGPNFDAHQFVGEAEHNGARALLVERMLSNALPQIVVEDTRQALSLLGGFNRARAQAKVVALTGSCGKTTVKEMLASIFAQCGNTLATQGNLNNEIGVPLTLLRLTGNEDFAVIEMGANHIGEIAGMTQVAKPDVALITNVAAAHLEGFGDLQGVAQAKGEIFQGLKENGVALINADSPFVDYWLQRIDKQVVSFGLEAAADFTAKALRFDKQGCAHFSLCTPQGDVEVSLSLPGEHNVANALAAAAAAQSAGAELSQIAAGLAQVKPVAGRLNVHSGLNGMRVIDDTYNANYSSLLAAMQLLVQYPGTHVVALGDMAELGGEGRSYHAKAGKAARELGIKKLYTVGTLSQVASDEFGEQGRHFSSRQELIQQLQREAKADVSLLVKGSRSARMEQVVHALVAEESNDSHSGGTD